MFTHLLWDTNKHISSKLSMLYNLLRNWNEGDSTWNWCACLEFDPLTGMVHSAPQCLSSSGLLKEHWWSPGGLLHQWVLVPWSCKFEHWAVQTSCQVLLGTGSLYPQSILHSEWVSKENMVPSKYGINSSAFQDSAISSNILFPGGFCLLTA